MSGPLHGGAPARVLPMIEEVERTGDARAVVKGILDRKDKLMGFGHRVYRAEDPRARVLRATAKRLEAPRFEVAAALEQAALAELRERRPDRAIETNVEFWAAVILDFAQVPAEDDARDVHLRAHRGLVRAHPRAEAARQAGAPGGHLRRPGAAQPGVRRGLGPDHVVVTGRDLRLRGAGLRGAGPPDLADGLGRARPRRVGSARPRRPHVAVADHGQHLPARPPPTREDVTSPVDYYVRIRDYASTLGRPTIVERGRQAGRDLGADPAATVDELLRTALDDVAAWTIR